MNRFLFCTFFIIFTISVFNTNKIFGNDLSTTVRIGLETNFKNKSELKINNNDIDLLFDEIENGEMLSSSGFKVSLTNSFFLKSITSYENFYEAFHQSNLLNYSNSSYNAKPAYLNKKFYILLGGVENESKLASLKTLYKNSELYKGTNLIEVKGDTSFLTDDQKSFSLKGDSEFTMLDTKKYRGSISFSILSGKITPVNVIIMPEYLYGVLASEMPASWPDEALKAQCVAARSYVYTSFSNHVDEGYNLCDTTHCQVYKGVAGETEKTNKVVEATRGIVAYYNNTVINGVFFSSSGGITDNSENAWVTEVPYLRSVVDSNETTPKIWTRTFTMDEISSLLEKSKANIGKATGISISKISNERVLELTIHGTNGTKVLKGESIRTFFSYSKDGSLFSRYFRINEQISKIDTIPTSYEQTSDNRIYVLGDDKQLESTVNASYVLNEETSTILDKNITAISSESLKTYSSSNINNSVPANKNVIQNVSGKMFTGTITLNGKGYGHGIGLSQYGAKGMAEAGYDYTQILKHYYSGIEIR